MLAAIAALFFISATLIRRSKADWDELLQVCIVSSTREVLSTPFCLCKRRPQDVCGQCVPSVILAPRAALATHSPVKLLEGRKKYD